MTAVAIVRQWPHYEWIGIALQCGLVLPAVVRLLRTPSPGAIARPGNDRRTVFGIVAAYLAVAMLISWYMRDGSSMPDENAYWHQAKIFNAGRALSEVPDAKYEGGRPGLPVRFAQEVMTPRGWYGKYPIGWPLLLAAGERYGVGWALAPLLGALTLLLIGRIARYGISKDAELPAVAISALSPFFLSLSVGRMSHPLMGALVAGAALAFVLAVRTGRLQGFAWMFAMLAIGFHVRPFTAALTAVVLGAASLVVTFRDKRRFAIVAVMGVIAAAASVGSVMAYNAVFTGDPLLSPYSVFTGRHGAPKEIVTSRGEMLRNLATTWRFSAQSTLVYGFPLIPAGAAYGFWILRKRIRLTYLFAGLFGATIIAYLVLVDSAASVIGERYWSEVYFCLVVLAAGGIAKWSRNLGNPGSWKRAAVTLAAAQLLILIGAAVRLDAVVQPDRETRKAAQAYANCDCVVFISNSKDFCTENLNLNEGDWRNAGVFYARDPGPSLRQEWTERLGHKRYVVLPPVEPGNGCIPGSMQW